MCENAIEIEAKNKEVMASQAGVHPLTGLIWNLPSLFKYSTGSQLNAEKKKQKQKKKTTGATDL